MAGVGASALCAAMCAEALEASRLGFAAALHRCSTARPHLPTGPSRRGGAQWGGSGGNGVPSRSSVSAAAPSVRALRRSASPNNNNNNNNHNNNNNNRNISKDNNISVTRVTHHQHHLHSSLAPPARMSCVGRGSSHSEVAAAPFPECGRALWSTHAPRGPAWLQGPRAAPQDFAWLRSPAARGCSAGILR